MTVRYLNKGAKLDDIEVKLKLSILKSAWITEIYNDVASKEGHKIIKNGWKIAALVETIRLSNNKSPFLDPFDATNP